jgi:hypothetical protein
MLNLFTNRWEDQRGKIWELPDLEQTHLMNIQKLLKDVISGVRKKPENCDQNIYELKASLIRIEAEITRRQSKATTTRTIDVHTYTSVSVRIHSGAKVSDIIQSLQHLSKTAEFELVNNAGDLIFSDN